MPLDRRHADAVADPQRRRGVVLARRRVHRLHARSPTASQQWKHYRGGTTRASGSIDVKDHAVEQIPQPEGRCNDLDPHWLGKTVYFRSDRTGEYNLFAYDTDDQEGQAADRLHRLSRSLDARLRRRQRRSSSRPATCTSSTPQRRQPTRLKIGVATDLVEARPRFVKGAKYIRNAAVSPSGARAVFEFRGEIVTVPAEKGDPRNLTEDARRPRALARPGRRTASRSPTSPTRAASTSCTSAPPTARASRRSTTSTAPASTTCPSGRRTARRSPIVDNSQSLYWIDLASGKVKKIASEPQYGPPGLRRCGRPGRRTRRGSPTPWATRPPTTPSTPTTLTTGKSQADHRRPERRHRPGLRRQRQVPVLPRLDRRRPGQPVVRPVQRRHAAAAARSTWSVLKKGVPSPLARESDEEKPKEDKPKRTSRRQAGQAEERQPVVIDFDGIDQRILALPVPAGELRAACRPAPRARSSTWKRRRHAARTARAARR